MRLVTTSASNDPESSWVAIDDFGQVVMVGDHLARLGHRDIAVLVETNQPAAVRDSASMQPGSGTSTTPLASPACASRCQGKSRSSPGATTPSSLATLPRSGYSTMSDFRQRLSA